MYILLAFEGKESKLDGDGLYSQWVAIASAHAGVMDELTMSFPFGDILWYAF